VAGEATTTDGLGRLHLRQPARGQRFSTDSVLLAGFAPHAAGPVADLGAGCGVVAVLLAARGLAGPFTCVELDPLAARCCAENLAAAGAPGRALCHDLTLPHPHLPEGGFALAVCTPPYTKAGHGRTPPEADRARARHEKAPGAAAWWGRAAGLLARAGRLAVAWPPDRLVEGLAGLQAAGLVPKRLRLVHPLAHRPAGLALVEAAKGGRAGLAVEPPLVVHSPEGGYGPEVRALYDSFS
jgi:tRNA1Val (adenine37-N6)-methyltransferase